MPVFKKHNVSILVISTNSCNFEGLRKSIGTPNSWLEIMVRGHTLITLAHKGTYLVCEMLTAVLSGTVVKMLTRVFSWSNIDKNVLT